MGWFHRFLSTFSGALGRSPAAAALLKLMLLCERLDILQDAVQWRPIFLVPLRHMVPCRNDARSAIPCRFIFLVTACRRLCVSKLTSLMGSCAIRSRKQLSELIRDESAGKYGIGIALEPKMSGTFAGYVSSPSPGKTLWWQLYITAKLCKMFFC